MKPWNLPCIDYFLFLLEVISMWQWNYVYLHTFKNLERLINFTTRSLWLQLSCFHEFMNSWIHDLSRYMKIRWWNMKAWKHAFMPLYFNYQGTWKSGDAKWSILSSICTAIIKVHKNQVNTYEGILSYICTAIIKVHENQVMQFEVVFFTFVLQLSR